jgi:hypothetical protein
VQIGFVDESRRVDGRVVAVEPGMTPGQAAEPRVGQLDQLLEGGLVAVAPALGETRDLVEFWHAVWRGFVRRHVPGLIGIACKDAGT